MSGFQPPKSGPDMLRVATLARLEKKIAARIAEIEGKLQELEFDLQDVRFELGSARKGEAQ